MILRFTETKQNYFAKVKIGFKHNTDEWDRYIADVRKKFPEKVKLIVAKTTQDLAWGTKADIPVKYAGLKSSPVSRVQGYNGSVIVRAHYGPYVEFGTGRLADIPSGYEKFASEFRGKGIREVNLPARPFFVKNIEKQKKNFFKGIEHLVNKI